MNERGELAGRRERERREIHSTQVCVVLLCFVVCLTLLASFFLSSAPLINMYMYMSSHLSLKHVYTRFGVLCFWWFHYPGLFLHTELLVSLFIRCTMSCEIWAQPAELPW